VKQGKFLTKPENIHMDSKRANTYYVITKLVCMSPNCPKYKSNIYGETLALKRVVRVCVKIMKLILIYQ
jgi:hypothetical protein